MKQTFLSIVALFLLGLTSNKLFAHDIAVENADGVTIYYNYYNNGTELQVTYKGSSYDSSNEYSGNVVIPETVTYMNRTRSVKSIGERAFHNSYGLTSVTIPSSVTSIGDYAFLSDNILTVVSMINNPRSISSDAFSQNTFMNASLYVPTGTKEKYKATNGWKKFVFIEEIDPSSLDIEPIHGDVAESSRYSLNGVRITSPQKGINIIKMSDGTTKKVLVK